MVDRRVLGDVRDKCRFAHGRSSREHDQVAGLEPPGQVVDVLEPRRRAGDRHALARDPLQLDQLVVEHRLDRADLTRPVVVRDPVERGLGLFQQLVRLAGEGEDVLLDPPRGVEQAAEHRVLLDDAAVLARVRGRRDEVRERVDVCRPAGFLQLAASRQLLGDGEGVDRLGLRLLLQPQHRPEDQPMALAIEVLGPQLDVDQQAVERLLGEQDRPEDRNLCFLILRRELA